ncbi:MAG TPA: hypothetical protein VF101_09160 [Gaiellaceae bacterium]
MVDHWVVIVLTVVSIVQGLALGRLADVVGHLHVADQWAASALAFIVVLRVFQTYVAAALEYNEWQISFVDIIVIFGLGLIQYQLIETISKQKFEVQSFEAWIVVVSAVAVIGHTRAYWTVKSDVVHDRRYRQRERSLQIANVAGAAICLVLATILLLLGDVDQTTFAAITAAQAVIIAMNIARSVHVTIHKPMHLAALARAVEMGAAQPSLTIDEVRAAREPAVHISVTPEVRYDPVRDVVFVVDGDDVVGYLDRLAPRNDWRHSDGCTCAWCTADGESSGARPESSSR